MADHGGELTVRAHRFRAGVADHAHYQEVREAGRGGGSRRAHLVIFIHGYADSRRKAKGSYKRLASLLKQMGLARELARTWWFYWPGNLMIPVLNQASYPYQISI